MQANVAYLREAHEDIVDTTCPLLVTAAGRYTFVSPMPFETARSLGRGDYQFLYVSAGQMVFTFDGKEQLLTAGHAVIFRPGEPQLYRRRTHDTAETHWVHFTGAEAETLLAACGLADTRVLSVGLHPDFSWLFRQMIQELQLRRTGFADMLAVHLHRLFLTANRYMTERGRVGSEMLDEIERATLYFNEHYNEPIVIEQYAAQRLMSPAWFISNFKRITKMTPLQYIVSRRLDNAINLLKDTPYTVTQIAAAVGYDNPLYFSRLFRKHTGLSPSAYRKRNK